MIKARKISGIFMMIVVGRFLWEVRLRQNWESAILFIQTKLSHYFSWELNLFIKDEFRAKMTNNGTILAALQEPFTTQLRICSTIFLYLHNLDNKVNYINIETTWCPNKFGWKLSFILYRIPSSFSRFFRRSGKKNLPKSKSYDHEKTLRFLLYKWW